jgi:AcrR family transcriptional regulator
MPVERPVERPLRKDAERNRRRILDTARTLFAEHGLDVTLNDIAHVAGVGVGTVYRRFPDRDRLIEELFEENLERVVSMIEAALDDPDAWQGLTSFLETMIGIQASDRAMKELVFAPPGGLERVTRIRARILPLAIQLVQRAQESGQLRADVTPTDMPLLQLMVGTVIDVARDAEPELRRRYLEILLQGLRAAPERPEPLRQPPLGDDRLPELLGAYRLPRR